MNTSTKMLCLTSTVISTLMVISSSSLLNMWVGMEINLMSFIPLISTPKNSFVSQSSMAYFLIQSVSSATFIMIMMMSKTWYLDEHMIKMLISLSMMAKLGVPPFHMWLPQVMSKIDWKMCMILMTWQKIAPLYVLAQIIELNNMIILMICLTTTVGAIGGLNQTSTRKIMAYSSINHMGWLIACLASFKKSWIMYMLVYSFIMIMFSSIMFQYNILFVNQMNIFFKTPMDKIMIIMMMLSIGGIPPFLGFLPKWVVIQSMISSSEFIMMSIMMTSSLITMSYYLRMTMSMNMIMSHSQKWMILSMTKKNYSMWILILNMILPMFILMMNF